jgi:voltage-gated potassium channel
VPIILSAVLPLVVAPEPGHPVSVAIGVVTWLVFVVDLVVHQRHQTDYLRTRIGMFDIAIVAVTAPWFLIPGAGAGSFVVVLRLARLARLVVASRGARELFARLGRVAIVAGAILFTCALIAFIAERPVNAEFATFGDSLWWALVTLTTVGYGDITPVTTTGRLAAATLMITGIAVLGLLAGSLATFLGLDPDADGDGAVTGAAASERLESPELAAEPADGAPSLADVMAELRTLKEAVARLEPPTTAR